MKFEEGAAPLVKKAIPGRPHRHAPELGPVCGEVLDLIERCEEAERQRREPAVVLQVQISE